MHSLVIFVIDPFTRPTVHAGVRIVYALLTALPGQAAVRMLTARMYAKDALDPAVLFGVEQGANEN